MTRTALIPETVTLHVPFRVVKRGGRKEMVLPEGATPPRCTDSTLVKALARAFRWKRMLESGEFTTVKDLAEREGIAFSYMTRVLRLSLLAPDLVEQLLASDGCANVSLDQLMAPFPADWAEQRVHFGTVLSGCSDFGTAAERKEQSSGSDSPPATCPDPDPPRSRPAGVRARST